ncbi:MAG: hypothetical protein IJ245_03220, partial [Lachnospiraceae bacterium]|nr:hypothetical protein [Lachnospiraceae bacterium]
MAEDYGLIKLKGSESFMTPDSKEYFEVAEGEANVYMQFNEGDVPDRSLFLRSAEAGDLIPGLACLLPESENKWHFVIIPKSEVTLKRFMSEDANAALGNE